MRDRGAECLCVLRYAIVVFDTDTKQGDVRTKLNEETKFTEWTEIKNLCIFSFHLIFKVMLSDSQWLAFVHLIKFLLTLFKFTIPKNAIERLLEYIAGITKSHPPSSNG